MVIEILTLNDLTEKEKAELDSQLVYINEYVEYIVLAPSDTLEFVDRGPVEIIEQGDLILNRLLTGRENFWYLAKFRGRQSAIGISYSI